MESSRANWREFPSPEALARVLAHDVAGRLERAIAARGEASIAVSGGTTPGRFLDALSRKNLDWAKVVVTLVDERFVPPASERSNERLVRDRLLVGEAAEARFVALYSGAATVEAAARAADAAIALLPHPLDVVVLGMGTDGHTASFFADAPNLAELTDAAATRRVLTAHTRSGGEPRLTLTLPQIADARLLALHIEGAEKREALERALAGMRASAPIRIVLAAAGSRPEIYWAP